METNFCKRAIENNGIIKPLLVDSEKTNGTGLCNPSVIVVNEKLIVNIRHVGYNLYHAEYNQKFKSWHGALIYLHPEDDLTLRTENYIGELDLDSLQVIKEFEKIDMTFNVNPLWTFIGLEDVRLVNWNNQLSMIGVRRDTTTNGEGRMEVTSIKNLKEISRVRIEPPNYSYCEKNWMPIINQPNRFVKWTNPTEVVKLKHIDEKKAITETICTNKIKTNVDLKRDLRGGSQVIPYNNGYIAITHEVDLWKHEDGTKDAHYYHRFVVFDNNLNIVNVSQDFKFMDARVEFVAGMAYFKNNFYITFGFQDNAAYILKVNEQIVNKFIVNG